MEMARQRNVGNGVVSCLTAIFLLATETAFHLLVDWNWVVNGRKGVESCRQAACTWRRADFCRYMAPSASRSASCGEDEPGSTVTMPMLGPE